MTMLMGKGFRTVEELANAGHNALTKLGVGAQDLQRRAREFVETGSTQKLEIKELKETVAKLTALVEGNNKALPEAKQAPKQETAKEKEVAAKPVNTPAPVAAKENADDDTNNSAERS